MPTDTITKLQAQRRITTLWFAMAALPTLLLGYNTLQGRFTDPGAIWQWYSPYLLPTLLLMVGTLSAAEGAADSPALSSVFYYRLCWWLSLVYGLCLLGAVVVGILNQANGTRALIDSLKLVSFMLTAVQSILSLALGAFFVSKPKPV
ncbi:hypothetical protein GCM10022409_01950 [Hymenobacter glaciei]|uniref:Uncharacterized protein n=1 Tax=Hymenobacter glaciei TaxID=877209 RepID=A0ABP7T7A7_9BACT